MSPCNLSTGSASPLTSAGNPSTLFGMADIEAGPNDTPELRDMIRSIEAIREDERAEDPGHARPAPNPSGVLDAEYAELEANEPHGHEG